MTLNYFRGANEQAAETYAYLFQTFAEPARLTILQHLGLGEYQVRELVDHLGLAQSTVSKTPEVSAGIWTYHGSSAVALYLVCARGPRRPGSLDHRCKTHAACYGCARF